MEQSTATRRLVKSPPELWAALGSEESLGRHLAEFGEIRIVRADPETTVAWEGDRVSGTVELAPTGWGTKVVLTATPDAPRRGFLARLFRRRAGGPAAGIPGPPVPMPDPSPPSPGPSPGPLPPAPDPTPPTPAPTPPAPQIRAGAAHSRPAILRERDLT